MTAFLADHYREELDVLVVDPIVIAMAQGLKSPDGLTLLHPVKELFGHHFMLAANAEYHARGGTNSRSLGGVPQALRRLVGADVDPAK